MIDISIDAVLEGHQGPIYTVISTPDKKSILTAGDDKIVAIWDLASKKDAKMIAKATSSVYSMCFFNNNRFLAIGQRDGKIHIVDFETKQEHKNITTGNSEIFVLEPISTGGFISGNAAGEFIIWSVNAEIISKHIISEKSIRSVAFTKNEDLVAIGCSDDKIYLHTFPEMKLVETYESHTNSVFALRFSSITNALLSGSRDAQLHIRQPFINQDFAAIKAHLFTINCIVELFDGKFIATSSRDKEIRVWKTNDMTLVKVLNKEKFNVHSHSVNKLLWLKDTNQLISVSDDKKIVVWNCKELA